MEARLLEAMQRRKKEIDDRPLKGHCIPRANRIGAIALEYQRTLNPHSFYLQMEDICQVSDIRRVVIDGTDEEFDACAEQLTSRLPKLTSQILEERTAKISTLLQFSERPDNVLSLATAWFNCGVCYQYLPMNGINVLMHRCPFPPHPPPGKPIREATFDSYVLKRGWCIEPSELTFSNFASTIARGLILDCGEDPESITLAEINSKLHRFVFYEDGELVAHNWDETVSHTSLLGVYYCELTMLHAPIQFNNKFYRPSAYYHFLGPDEFPEFVHDPDAYNEIERWDCLHCWRHGNQIFRISNYATLPTVKQHITEKRVLSKLCTMYIR